MTDIGICERCGHPAIRHIWKQGVPCDCCRCNCDNYQGRVEYLDGRVQRYEAPPPAVPVSITCPRCAATSWNLNDVRNRYCARCHVFLDDLEALERAGQVSPASGTPSPPPADPRGTSDD